MGRRHIVQVLHRLAYDSLVTLHRNRGAFVAMPGKEEARAIFDARKVIETEITRLVAQSATREKLVTVAPQRRGGGRVPPNAGSSAKPSAFQVNSISCSALVRAIPFSTLSFGNSWRALHWWLRCMRTRTP